MVNNHLANRVNHEIVNIKKHCGRFTKDIEADYYRPEYEKLEQIRDIT